MDISDLASKVIGDKRRWRAYQARARQLPDNYRTALDAVQRYAFRSGSSDADNVMQLLEDLVDLFEGAAANGVAIRDVVGDDPVDFAETFIDNYGQPAWLAKERDRLTRTLDDVAEVADPEHGGGR